MDYRFTPAGEEFRNEFKSWLEKTFPANEPPPKLDTVEDRINAYRSYQKKLSDGGYAGIRYPRELGGRGGTLMEEIIVTEELNPYAIAHAANVNSIGFGMGLPTIFAVGTEEQKKDLIPKLLDGTHIWCQAFSEPNSGSDAASISTRAEKKDGYYLVNGQKVWITSAQYADMCMLLVRTNPDVPKHKGLSYLLMDMKLPGVEVRPIKQISEESEFNEIFIDNVKVPENMLVGAENEGWGIAITTLMFERIMGDLSMAKMFIQEFYQLLEMAREMKRGGQPVLNDYMFRQKLAQIYIELMVLKYNGYRSAGKAMKGGMPGPEGSIGKLLWSETHKKMTELAMEIQGMANQLMKGSPLAVEDGYWQYLFLTSKSGTIAAGTSEILKNIIGERVLGLPKDMARALFAKKER
ncbi:MAG: acyl-CoA dehydrogenase family protein [Deltaproteobacteria bacterium]|nr:acyl-CoA dehydrogenase family protein [Deltaproteobacteria bacterium]MBW2141142.1 acyl-CoA dehydrogenase family protein [Deltaproteobacteria bacterium]MBW2323093.1 acyl-CoA dehydrogenase family protein [Deltaproteobacteria bacterium]